MTKTFQLSTLVTAFAVALLLGAFGSATEAAAFMGGGDDITVENSNEADVTNNLEVEAETGDNDANGGDGEEGGHGGDADSASGLAVGGNGGTGGTGGAGGTVDTGAAVAIGTIDNDINRNITRISGCGCDEEESMFGRFFGRGENITVRNTNSAGITNNLEVEAETGDNDVNGGDGEEGGNGGDANVSRNRGFWWWFLGSDDNVAAGGHGGAGGNGATAGEVTTGISQADGLVTNVVNRNVTRIVR